MINCHGRMKIERICYVNKPERAYSFGCFTTESIHPSFDPSVVNYSSTLKQYVNYSFRRKGSYSFDDVNNFKHFL